MSISSLWQHCIEYHSESSQASIMLEATETTSHDAMTATLSVSITLDINSYTFFKIRTKYNTYNMCMHITTMLDTESESNDVVFCLRRFFPEVSLSFEKILLSVEIGDVCGMLLPVPSVVSAYENMQGLKELASGERIYKMIQVPRDLFKQISMGFDKNNEDIYASDHQNPTMMISVQFFFKEISGQTEDEEEDASPATKRIKQ